MAHAGPTTPPSTLLIACALSAARSPLSATNRHALLHQQKPSSPSSGSPERIAALRQLPSNGTIASGSPRQWQPLTYTLALATSQIHWTTSQSKPPAAALLSTRRIHYGINFSNGSPTTTRNCKLSCNAGAAIAVPALPASMFLSSP